MWLDIQRGSSEILQRQRHQGLPAQDKEPLEQKESSKHEE